MVPSLPLAMSPWTVRLRDGDAFPRCRHVVLQRIPSGPCNGAPKTHALAYPCRPMYLHDSSRHSRI